MKIKKYLWEMIYGLLLTAFTVYILLDTFVITRTYTPAPSGGSGQNTNSGSSSIVSSDNNTGGNETQKAVTTGNTYEDDNDAFPSENNTDGKEAQEAVITETEYKDDNISITLTQCVEYTTNIYVADVQLSSAEYLKTAFAQGAYGKNITDKTSVTAQSVNAIFAVNGDYYGVREEGYVLRNGDLYRNSPSGREDLAIYKDGSFLIFKEGEISAEELLSDGAEQILCFGPGLVTNGDISVPERNEAPNPRTAIGMIDDLHYVFVVSDGRVGRNKGLTYYELAEFMQSLGAKEAYNLDGGGSTAMYFNGNVINNLDGGERAVSDIVYIGY